MRLLKFLPLLILFVSCEDDKPEVEIPVLPETLPTEGLVAYYPLDGNTIDLSDNGLDADFCNAVPEVDRHGAEEGCYMFNGTDQYIEVADADALSIATTGQMSISVWIRPDVYNFPNTEGNGYVHWLGKGENNAHEWLMRMYNLSSERPNRISGYVFNLSGGLGSGSYTEEIIVTGDWIHLVLVYDYPANAIKIYKNAVLKDEDMFTDYEVIPENGLAPMRIGTRDFKSYFEGAIDDLCIYNRELTESEINTLFTLD